MTTERLLAALLALALAAPARANMAAIEVRPSGLAGPRFLGPTPLRIDREVLSFDCSERDGVPGCTFEARYRFHNPTQAPTVALCAFYGVRSRDVRISLDGSETRAPLDDDARSRLDQAVLRGPGGTDWNREKMRIVDRIGFTIAAAPGSEHELRVTGALDFVPRGPTPSYGASAVVARHLQFATREGLQSYFLDYLFSPIKTWGGDPEISVSIRSPASWSLEPHWSAGTTATSSLRADGKFEVRSWRFRASEVSTELRWQVETGSPGEVFGLAFESEEPPFSNGGPLLGLGGSNGLLLRVGYEVARRPWFLCQLAVDTDFKDRVVVAPLLELASPAVLIIPSFGVGLGLPLQLLPGVRVGARLQLDVMLYAVGFAASLDLFPAAGGEPGKAQLSLLGQLGL